MVPSDDQSPLPVNMAARVMAAILGITFGGIGLAVMIFLWTERGFGEPPTFFKIFGTFVALPFVGFGVIALLGVFGIKSFSLRSPAESVAEQLRELRREAPMPGVENASSPTNYHCPHCGAPLASSSDASPHGDVKCKHCETWFNIFGK